MYREIYQGFKDNDPLVSKHMVKLRNFSEESRRIDSFELDYYHYLKNKKEKEQY